MNLFINIHSSATVPIQGKTHLIHDVDLPLYDILEMFYWIQVWFKYDLRWLVLCEMSHYLAGVSHYKIGKLLLWRDVYGQQQNSRLFNIIKAQLELRDPNCVKKKHFSHDYTTSSSLSCWLHDRLGQRIYETRWHFSSLQLSSLIEFIWNDHLHSFLLLTEVKPTMVFCCCPSASWFNVGT